MTNLPEHTEDPKEPSQNTSLKDESLKESFFRNDDNKGWNERWLVIASVAGFLFLVGSTFYLDSLSSGIQWIAVGEDSQGNDYSVDQRWTIKALESQGDSPDLKAYPYAVRVGYVDETRMVKGFKIKAVLEQGKINCVNSTVKAKKWMFLDVSESPIRLEQNPNQKGLLQESSIKEQVVNFVCALKK